MFTFFELLVSNLSCHMPCQQRCRTKAILIYYWESFWDKKWHLVLYISMLVYSRAHLETPFLTDENENMNLRKHRSRQNTSGPQRLWTLSINYISFGAKNEPGKQKDQKKRCRRYQKTESSFSLEETYEMLLPFASCSVPLAAPPMSESWIVLHRAWSW